MKGIADIINGGGGVTYTNIVYNEDNTITLTDKDGVEHIMSCTYEDDKLIGVTYDGKAVELIYDGDVLVEVGKTEVDMANAPVLSSGASLNIAYGETAPEDTSIISCPWLRKLAIWSTRADMRVTSNEPSCLVSTLLPILIVILIYIYYNRCRPNERPSAD